MSRYDGLIIPRGYNDYISKTDAATLLQALQLSGVMDNAPTADSVHPVKSGGIKTAIDNAVDAVETSLEPVDTVTKDNMHSVTSNAVFNALKKMTSGTIVLDPNYTTRGEVTWTKIGNLVQVNIRNLVLTSWNDGDKKLGAGLPLPITLALSTIPCLNSSYSSGASQLFSVLADGSLYTGGGISNIGEYYGSFCYISAS